MRRPGSAADLLPVLEIGEDFFVTTDGRLGAVLECSGLNLRHRSAEGADAVAAAFRDLLDFLDPGAHLQLVVESAPLRPREWVGRYVAQFRPPPGLEGYVARTGAWLAGELSGHSIVRHSYYAVATLPGPPPPRLGRRLRRRLRGERALTRERDDHHKALADLGRVASEVADSLAALEISVSRLDGRAVAGLLWRCANPRWGAEVEPPHEPASPEDLRCLRDRLAQSRLVERPDHLRVDGEYEATLSLRALPNVTFSGWLDRLTALGLTYRLALHVDALDTARELSKLELAHTRRHNVLAERAERGRGTDFRQGQALDEIAGVLRDMVTGDTRTFKVAVVVTVRANSLEELRAGLREVGKALRDAGGTAVDRCYLGQADGWRATLPLGANPLGMGYRATSLNLSHTFPFLNHRAGTPGGPLLGFSDPGHEVVTLDLGDPGLTNGNAIVTGKQGSGKTMLAQRLCLDCACMGIRVVVLDRSTGHFADLVAATPGAAAHRVGLDGSFRINPWELPRGRRAPTQEKLDYLLDLLTLLAGERHGEDQHLTGEERGILESGCRAVYASAPEPGPYMRHLHAWLLDRRDESPAHRALAQRLAPYVGEGAYAGLLDGPTTVRPGDVLEVFNFAGVSPRVAALAMLPLIEHIWSVIADPERLTLLVMDEGWSLLQGQASARFMSEVTRTGRHHGLLTLNISQFVSDYEGPLGQAVLDSRSVALLLQQNDGQVRRAGELFGLTEDEADALARLKTVKHRRAGAYLHSRDGAVSGSLAVYHTPEQYWLFTSYRPERELRAEAIARHGGDVWAAVRELAEAVPPGSVSDRAPDEGAGPLLRAL